MLSLLAGDRDGSTRLHLFEDDVDVSGDELSDLLSLGGLDRVVPVLVVSEVLRGGREAWLTHGPPPEGGRVTRETGFDLRLQVSLFS